MNTHLVLNEKHFAKGFVGIAGFLCGHVCRAAKKLSLGRKASDNLVFAKIIQFPIRNNVALKMSVKG